jgi:Domain of unknown function (DUF4350)
MKLNNRPVWIGILVLVTLILLSLWVAPQAPQLQQGSTYSRKPGGYGAWYAYMEQQQLPMQRWQRPLDQLPQGSQSLPSIQQIAHRDAPSEAAGLSIQAKPLSPLTLVQINSSFGRLGVFNEAWVRQGNVLVLIGERAPVSQAPFRSLLDSPSGAVKLETSRRYQPNDASATERSTIKIRLGDAFGAVVWEQQLGQGRVIAAVTPYLAANAYQDQPGNFKFLARLVSEPGYPIYVDEYLHGYRDQADIAADHPEGLASYLAKTPLLLLAVQAAVLLLLLIWGQNQRLGPPQPWVEPTVNHSEAYIQALAGVLQKANCTDFVVETLGKAEQRQIQRHLGLGPTLLEPQAVIDVWVQQTGRPAAELESVLEPLRDSGRSGAQRLSNRALTLWLEKLQTLRRQLE